MILQARWVVPIARPPIPGGYVDVEGGQIWRVGSADTLPAVPPEQRQALGNVVLTPGLVNPHTHLELTRYAGRIGAAPFWDWIAELVRLRRAPGRIVREREAAAEGAWHSLRAGVTCVGDISRENVAWQALRSIPIRKVCFVELLSLADDPPRNPEELRAAAKTVSEDALLTVGITPHAPYSVPAEQIRAAVALAEELDRPWCTHWAESREEVAFLAGDRGAIPGPLQNLLAQCGVRPPRLPPVEDLERCTTGARPGLLAHMNYVGEEELERLAEAEHTVVYCPRAHRFFGHPPHPFARLRAAGVKVVFGTDSLASNESLSVLAELQHVHRSVAGAPGPGELLRLATLEAARALRLDDRVGTLEAGKQADLAAFPCRERAEDPVAVLIEDAPAPVGVWVAGQRVV